MPSQQACWKWCWQTNQPVCMLAVILVLKSSQLTQTAEEEVAALTGEEEPGVGTQM